MAVAAAVAAVAASAMDAVALERAPQSARGPQLHGL